MRTLASHEYGYLAELAKCYRDKHLAELKKQAHFNPRLGVDALCFQHVDARISGVGAMVGALITPCELWLVAVLEQATLQAPLESQSVLTLPSGNYTLHLERLPAGIELYKRKILEDLSDLETLQEAARLAQRMMEQLMTSPPAPSSVE
ncbi:[NiFe]-hydrogenase assembly chaperone HybE [Vreelandella aquamarina]|uniref:[NiFe]-hydrogenase assembly chaperone HybE n=1 Tax=Vreelandella aquamarina TaxID=77097 RepID=UPI00384AB7B2